MRKSKFSDSQIMAMIKQNEAGTSVPSFINGAPNMVEWTLQW
jgi:hypothetical protein